MVGSYFWDYQHLFAYYRHLKGLSSLPPIKHHREI
jgi:hypothetical protein